MDDAVRDERRLGVLREVTMELLRKLGAALCWLIPAAQGVEAGEDIMVDCGGYVWYVTASSLAPKTP